MMLSQIKSPKVWFRIVYLLLLSAGQLWHIYQISEPFFRYQVSSTISIKITENIEPQTMNFCFPAMSHVTIADAMSQFPNVENVTQDKFQGELCMHFKCKDIIARKYYYQNMVCYSYEINDNNRTFTLRNLRQFYGTNLMMKYMFDASKNDKSINSVFVFMNDKSTSPLTSLVGESMLEPNYQNKLYTMTTSRLRSYLLKTPYADDCFDYTIYQCHNQDVCFTTCLNDQTSQEFNLSYAENIYYDSINQSLLVPHMLTSNQVGRYVAMFNKCSGRFGKADCFNSRIKSKLTPYRLSHMFGVLWLIPVEPSTDIVSSPAIPLVDYVTFILGSLGNWFGFSFIGIFPHSLFEKNDKKSRIKENCNTLPRQAR